MAAPAKKAKYREKLEAVVKAFTDPDYNVMILVMEVICKGKGIILQKMTIMNTCFDIKTQNTYARIMK